MKCTLFFLTPLGGLEMGRKILLIALFFICGMFSISTFQTRGLVRYLPSGKPIYEYQNSWAVLVGINKYENWPQLEYAVQDAKDMKELLIKEFSFADANITLLTDEEATLVNIKKALGDDLRKKVSENDRVLVFWAGHGQTDELPGGGKMGYLIPVKGSKTDYYSTCLSMTEIKNLAKLIPAKHMLFLVDACYSGLAAIESYGMSAETEGYLEKITRSMGRQIITAGGEGEEVVENSLWGHSAFTHQLLEGLTNQVADEDNDGVITATELASYLKPRVTKLSDYRQTPHFSYLSGDGEFVFITKNAFRSDIPIVGTIHVRTEPWCTVSLDGEQEYTSPYIIKDVSLGQHRLVLHREGYKTIVHDITISDRNRYIKVSEQLLKE